MDEINKALTVVSNHATVAVNVPNDIKNFLDSYQLQNNSIVTKFLDLSLPADKNSKVTPISLYDGALVATGTTGLVVMVTAMTAAAPVFVVLGLTGFIGSIIPLSDRRGQGAALAVPLLLQAAAQNPEMAVKALGAVASGTVQVVKAAADTSLKTIGVLVSAAGVVMGLVLTKKYDKIDIVASLWPGLVA